MDMRTKFEFTVKTDDDAVDTVMCHGWQDAVEALMTHCQNNGFTIDEKRKRQIVELAKFGRVTV